LSNGLLGSVGGIRDDHPAAVDELIAGDGVDGDEAEGGGEGVDGRGGHGLEGRPVSRAEEDDPLDLLLAPGDPGVGGGGDGTGVEVTGVGRNDRLGGLRRRRAPSGGLLQGGGDPAAELVGIGRIERPGHRRRANGEAGHGRPGAIRTAIRRGPQCPGGPSNTPAIGAPHDRQRPSSVSR
jgi:hypothetical protein